MRKLWLLAPLVLVLTSIFVTANVAVADNGATTTPFKVVYTPAFGSWTCTGAHIVKTAPNPVHKESQSCTDPNSTLPAGTYDLVTQLGWFSDYHYFILNEGFVLAIAGTLVSDGAGNYEVVSYYAP